VVVTATGGGKLKLDPVGNDHATTCPTAKKAAPPA
jgi:hypothetical protein